MTQGSKVSVEKTGTLFSFPGSFQFPQIRTSEAGPFHSPLACLLLGASPSCPRRGKLSSRGDSRSGTTEDLLHLQKALFALLSITFVFKGWNIGRNFPGEAEKHRCVGLNSGEV